MFHKIKTAFNIIKLYSTWRLAVLNVLGLSSGIIRHRLRNGTEYIIRADKEDLGSINSIYIGREYHRCLYRIKDNSTVIDIGAYIGTFSIFARDLAENVSVLSYEPFDENFRLLKDNIRLNNAGDDIRAFNVGVGGRKARAKFFINRQNPSTNSMFKESSEAIEIDTITLKDIFDDNAIKRCDFLKMDCEGAEYEILLNTPVEYMDKIMSISMEYHDPARLNELTALLKRCGFTVMFEKRKDHLLYADRIA